jgi:hypothetical protein
MMTKHHPRKLLLTATALGAMALGGTAIAQAASSTPAHPAEKITRHDTDNVQSGNQTAPDPATPSSAAHRAVHGRHVASRTGERNGENPENSGETNTENGPSDGPSGHADPPGNVDHQFSGTE